MAKNRKGTNSAGKSQRVQKFLIFILYIIILLTISFIYALVHECGHALWSVIFGLKICGFEVQIFIWEMADSHVYIEGMSTLADWQYVLVCVGGSTLNLIVGLLLFGIAYKYVLNRISETVLGLFGLALTMDFILYNILDVFFLQRGDWFALFKRYPVVNGIFLIVGVIFIVLFFSFHEKIDANLRYLGLIKF